MKKYDVIGLMSGTSLDGLDIAAVRFVKNQRWEFEILHCQSVSYDDDLINQLGNAHQKSALDLKKLDLHLGYWFGDQTKKFMDFHHFIPELIVSHGHTIFHQPKLGITHQIGDAYQIRVKTDIKTIADLRSLDVALGGQGAPLVPIGDQLLFGQYDYCLNLGGFSNISFEQEAKRIAFDICPVNTVLNHLATKLDLQYDAGGNAAKTGYINKGLLATLNSLNYYTQTPPKSLGIEWVVENILPLLTGDSPANLLKTYNHHIADQIVWVLENDIMKINKEPTLLVTGGGAKNNFLISLLQTRLTGKVKIIVPDHELIDFKEAILFAFLGLLRSLGETNTLSSVTGARKDSSGGLIFD